MENKRRKEEKGFVWLLIVICLFISFFTSLNSIYFVSAEETVYSDVLSDLQKDETFSIEDYPVNLKDFSLQVIQVAEGENKELFVYVYQPCSPNEVLTATCINMATNYEGTNRKLFDLNLINSNGVFAKYLVEDFVVKDENVRFYDISSIYRLWIESYDEGLPVFNENTIDEVAFEVAKVWTAYSHENDVLYSCLDTEVVTITDKYVGFIRYETDYQGGGYDSHFVAFNTDRDIDRLIDAEVYYSSQTVSGRESSPEFGNVEENQVFLSASEKHEILASNGWFSHWTYEWNEIQSIDEFIASVETENVYNAGIFNVTVETGITEEGYEDLVGKQWVLRFATTDYNVEWKSGGMLTYKYVDKTLVGDVTILRLKFETDGVTYNLGVVDNKQTGSDVPDNFTESHFELANWAKILFIVIGVVFALLLISPFLPAILSFLWTIVKCIFKGVWWVITAPFEVFFK